MKKTTFLLALFCAACGSQPSAEKSGTTEAVSPKVLLAAKIADAIKAEPGRAEEILAENDMTAQAFSDLMIEIAADEKMSADYAKARTR
jgi:hypothetical protein